MTNDFLLTQIKKLQNEYYDFLTNALTNSAKEDFFLTLDEINLFWYSNREIVKLILNNISSEYECYIFTGASFLDIDDNEHFPFVAFGKIHIVDDPLHKFIEVPQNIKDHAYKTRLKEQIVNTIKDNIQIIEKYVDAILIFPVTLLTDIGSEIIMNATERAFFSMFKDVTMTKERYFLEFKNIEDIISALDEDMLNTIIFDENDDLTINIGKRFRDFLAETNPFGDQLNEAIIFISIVSGFFAQALNILLTCAQYNMIPYIRYNVIYRYTVLLGSNFAGNKHIDIILFKMSCAHLLYQNFDKRHIVNISFDDYLKRINSMGFNDAVFNRILENDLYLKKFSAKEISKIIQSELHRILNV